MLRFAAALSIGLALFTGAKEGDVVDRAGLLGTCEVVQTPPRNWGEWWACKDGRLSGAADLSTRGCEAMGAAIGFDYWRCPAPLQQDRKTG